MKIALINENSQATKNGIIEAALKKVVEPMGHEVVNYGMYTAEDAAQLTYVQCGILAAILLNSGAADYVITGCGTGEGAMLALNSFPGRDLRPCGGPRWTLTPFAHGQRRQRRFHCPLPGLWLGRRAEPRVLLREAVRLRPRSGLPRSASNPSSATRRSSTASAPPPSSPSSSASRASIRTC